MLQVIGKIVSKNNVYNKAQILGFTLYDLNSGRIFGAYKEKCYEGVKRGLIKNLSVEDNQFVILDGTISELPTYNSNGDICRDALPVIIEKVILKGVPVGYTYIDENGVYKRAKSDVIVNRYRGFFNARIVMRKGKSVLASKRGKFEELKIEYNDFEIDNGILKRYKGKNKRVIIPSGVTVIDDGAFCGNNEIVSVSFPSSLIEIGNSAFLDCTKLSRVSLPDSVVSIGSSAFKNCRELSKVVLSNSLTKINNCVFEGCTKLRSITIPNSVICISNYTFDNCISLRSIKLGYNLKEIGNDAFRGCAIEGLEIPKSVIKIGKGAFCDCKKLSNIKLPDSLKDINKGVFNGCDWDCRIKCDKGSYAYNFISSYYPQFLDVT